MAHTRASKSLKKRELPSQMLTIPFDSYLLTQFPGRTLDELDDMDLLRFLRAMARNVSSLEESRYMVETGKRRVQRLTKKIGILFWNTTKFGMKQLPKKGERKCLVLFN